MSALRDLFWKISLKKWSIQTLTFIRVVARDRMSTIIVQQIIDTNQNAQI